MFYRSKFYNQTKIKIDQASFIWIRGFDNASVISSTEAAYFAAPERKALGDLPQKLIASMTITVMTDGLQNDRPN